MLDDCLAMELSVIWYLAGGVPSSSEGGLWAVWCCTCPAPTRIIFVHPAGALLLPFYSLCSDLNLSTPNLILRWFLSKIPTGRQYKCSALFSTATLNGFPKANNSVSGNIESLYRFKTCGWTNETHWIYKFSIRVLSMLVRETLLKL